jgi:SPP1 family predicted phage head-tail adaptor
MIKPGELRHKVKILAPPTTQNDFGEIDLSNESEWTTFKEVWASVEPLKGRELFTAQQINSEITLRIKMWYVPGVKAKMRIESRGQTFEIVGPPIDNKQMNRELELMCKEVS